MLKKILKNKVVILSSLLFVPLLSSYGCNVEWNNPFYPKAELSVTRITSPDTEKGVGIVQTLDLDNNKVEYKFNNPIIDIQNRTNLPRVIFKQAIVSYTVGSVQIPSIRFPILVTVPEGGQFNGTISILQQKEALINTVFPNDTPTTVLSGNAEVSLLGLDDNGYVIVTQFVTPIGFSSNIVGTPVNTSPSPSPSPSSAIRNPNSIPVAGL